MKKRLRTYRLLLRQLIQAKIMPFDSRLWTSLPNTHGVYRILLSRHKSTLYVGRTKTAEGGLKQRIYRNHLMGTQKGNIKGYLLEDHLVQDLQGAKQYLRKHCAVQIVQIRKPRSRKWFEHFAIAMLRPRFSE